MSRLIPKEHLTAVERWEIGSFDRVKQAPMEPIELPTAAELEALQQHAHDEGYQAGLGEAQAEGVKLRNLAHSFSRAIAGIETSIAEEILNLALDLANQMLRQALTVKPDLILPVVREVIDGLTGSLQNPVLILNPADVKLVTQRFGDELSIDSWKILADDRIESGGCRVESANGEIDATLATRWQRVISTLDSDHAWLE
jgi:flagellar assembly protein FliH